MKDRDETKEVDTNELLDPSQVEASFVALEDLEEACIRSERKYRTLFEESRDGVYSVLKKGEMTDANPSFLKLFGYAKDELIGGDIRDLYVDPADRPRFQNEIEKKGFVKDYEIKFRKKDGTEMDCLVTSSVEFGDDAKIVGYRGTMRDVTDQKRAELALRESEERYRAVFENISVGINVIDQNGKFTQANPALVKMLGYSETELRRLSPLDVTHPEDVEKSEQPIQAFLRGESGPWRVEKRYIKKDGSVIWGDLSVSTIRDSDDRPKAAVGVIADITEAKKAEEALRASEERLELALKGADLGFWDWDLKTGTAVFNERQAEMSGYSPAEIKPTVRAWKNQVHPKDWPKVSQALNGHLGGHLPFYEAEYRIRCRSGEWKWILGRGKVVAHDAAGNPLRMTGTSLDINERKAAEQERERLTAQLLQAQKMEAVGTLAGGIAHDFNNLLTIVLGFSDLLLAGKDERDPSYADLKKIYQAALNGADLVKKILAFSRKSDTNPRPVNLNWHIEEVNRLLSRTLPKMIKIKLVLSDPISTVSADPTQMEQILLNLAVNAKDAMPDGGKLTIATQNATLDGEFCRLNVGAKPGDYVLVSVTDTGRGMDEETLKHVFEPFYTTKELGRGTGLGLAMVYGILQQHRGYITCESVPGKGTTFNIYLPALDPGTESAAPTQGLIADPGTETILLVDDEEFVRDLGKRILERSGYTVLTAANGKAALELYRVNGNEISMVILDLIMPEMGGKDCFQELLKINSKVKILIASGYTSGGTLKDAVDLGAGGSIRKPYDMKQMLRAVREVLDRR